MERVTRDSNNIYWFFVDGFPYLISNAVTVAGILVIMFLTSVKLTLSVILGAAIILVLYPLFEKLFRKLHHKVWVQNSNLTSKVSDNINGHRIIKAFSKEDEELMAEFKDLKIYNFEELLKMGEEIYAKNPEENTNKIEAEVQNTKNIISK